MSGPIGLYKLNGWGGLNGLNDLSDRILAAYLAVQYAI